MNEEPALKPEDTQALLQLIALWHGHRNMNASYTSYEFAPVAVPDELRSTVTHEKRERTQALKDGAQWLGLNQPLGLGPTYTLLDLEITTDPKGRPVISPFRYRTHWATIMSAMDPAYREEHQDAEWACVVCEPEGWKVAAFWNEEERASLERQIELFRRHNKKAR
jgi:hypothetical protein